MNCEDRGDINHISIRRRLKVVDEVKVFGGRGLFAIKMEVMTPIKADMRVRDFRLSGMTGSGFVGNSSHLMIAPLVMAQKARRPVDIQILR